MAIDGLNNGTRYTDSYTVKVEVRELTLGTTGLLLCGPRWIIVLITYIGKLGGSCVMNREDVCDLVFLQCLSLFSSCRNSQGYDEKPL